MKAITFSNKALEHRLVETAINSRIFNFIFQLWDHRLRELFSLFSLS